MYKYNNESKPKINNIYNDNIIYWLKNQTNFCRYDSFLTLMSYVITMINYKRRKNHIINYIEKKILIFNKCNKDFFKLLNFWSPLISISSTELEYSDITTIFIDKKFTDALEFYLDCDSKFKIKTCSVNYDID